MTSSNRFTPGKYHSYLEERVAKILNDSDAVVSHEYSPRVGGLQPDFVARTFDGATVVIEVKGWRADGPHIERARRQVEGYKVATGADAALVVLGELPSDQSSEGVVGVDRLHEWLAQPHRSGVPDGGDAREAPSPQSPVFSVFAAMPFSSAYDDVYLVAMSYAAGAVGATCVRIDKEDFEGDIVSEIQKRIKQSAAVIADVSESRPNVLYEVGYAHALGKPIVHICSTPMSELPFDVAHQNMLKYAAGQTFELRDRLARRLKAAIAANVT